MFLRLATYINDISKGKMFYKLSPIHRGKYKYNINNIYIGKLVINVIDKLYLNLMKGEMMSSHYNIVLSDAQL